MKEHTTSDLTRGQLLNTIWKQVSRCLLHLGSSHRLQTEGFQSVDHVCEATLLLWLRSRLSGHLRRLTNRTAGGVEEDGLSVHAAIPTPDLHAGELHLLRIERT